MKKITLLWILFLFTVGCILPGIYSPTTTVDKFNGIIVNRTNKNTLKMPSIGGPLYIDIAQIKDKNIISYSLIVEYKGGSWAFIEDGDSLLMLIDGELITFNGLGSYNNRDVLSNGIVREIAIYPVSVEQIKKIANAKIINVRIKGSSFFLERDFKETTFNNFKQFIEEFIK